MLQITPNIDRFINHFGEMSSRWGFNRTVGRIYALLLLSEEPLPATTIGELLSISRGNVSMAVKELQSWRLVKTDFRPGDRKEYYKPAGSIIEMARIVAEERRKREVDPTLSLVRDILLQAAPDKQNLEQDDTTHYEHRTGEGHADHRSNPEEQYAIKQITAIHDLLESSLSVFDELQQLSPQRIQTLMKLGNGLGKVMTFSMSKGSTK